MHFGEQEWGQRYGNERGDDQHARRDLVAFESVNQHPRQKKQTCEQKPDHDRNLICALWYEKIEIGRILGCDIERLGLSQVHRGEGTY